MIKKNDILSSSFLDFQIFAPSDHKTEQIVPGQSNQFTSLVVYQPEAKNEELETFLSNILTAAKLDMSKDVFLLKTTIESGFSFSKMKTNATIEKVIIFGIPPGKLGINLDLQWYVPMTFQNRIFLLANSLSVIRSDVNKKRALWSCLQEIYLK